LSSSLPNQDSLQIPIVDSRFKPVNWATLLSGYWDKIPILDGIVYGWDIGVFGVPCPSSTKQNHPSAISFADDVCHYLSTKLAHGCLLGPLDSSRLPFPVSVTPLGTIPKQNSDRQRIITDCTFNDKGINAWIPKQWYRGQPRLIKIPTVDSIVAQIKLVHDKYPSTCIVGFKMDLDR
jgi:hypothetical protein